MPLPHAVEISDWLKGTLSTLVGAVIGFIMGTITDISKNRLNEKRKRKAMRWALYCEIADLYVEACCVQSRVGSNLDGDEGFRQVSIDRMKLWKAHAYEYCKSNPEVFYTLPDWPGIELAYDQLNLVRTINGLLPGEILRFGKNVALNIERLLTTGVSRAKLEPRLFRRIAPKVYKLVLVHVDVEEQISELRSHPSDTSEKKIRELTEDRWSPVNDNRMMRKRLPWRKYFERL